VCKCTSTWFLQINHKANVCSCCYFKFQTVFPLAAPSATFRAEFSAPSPLAPSIGWGRFYETHSPEIYR
jgi:hypothetical protein